MPLTGSAPVLATAMRAALLAIPNGGWSDNAALTAMCNAIATTVLTHITANAVVATTGTAVAQTGVVT
jgi:hypothetical protein